MKETLISHLHEPQLMSATAELFEFIELTYAISQADQRFISFFVKVLKENYSHLNFEQIESAFERNSLSLLDVYLNRIGQRPDNKIKSFNVPDLTKIINAYSQHLNLSSHDHGDEIWNPFLKRSEPGKKIFTEQEKRELYENWVNFLIRIFEIYQSNNEKTKVFASLYMLIKFSDWGLVDKKDIPEQKPDMNFQLKSEKISDNEIKIYETFEGLINQGQHINEFIN